MLDWFVYKVHPRPDHMALLLDELRRLEPVEDAEDDVVEIDLVREPYDDPLVVLFREEGEFGIFLGDAAPGRTDAWWQARGFQRIQHEPYIDPETDEEHVKVGSPLRFPVPLDEFVPLVVEALIDYLGVSPTEKLIASNNSNADEWPWPHEQIPFIRREDDP